MDKAKIKSQIEKEIKVTQSKINDLKEQTKPISPENAIGRVSRMDAINNKSVNEASLRQAQDKLNKLEIAITKIDSKEFGICVKCQKPIPVGRLMLMPHSNKCVNCA
ncbi:MAG: TraR/DksA C4-type zinc finger protein [Reichenbachiella sp.]